MNDDGVGRLLIASLHQGIADVLPSRLEFYESWLNPSGLREGRIGLAPLAAVLSFLRQEGEAYRLVAARAGEYSAEWTVAELPSFERTVVSGMPDAIRLRLVARIARRMVRQTYGGSRAMVRWRKGRVLLCSVPNIRRQLPFTKSFTSFFTSPNRACALPRSF